MAGRSWVSSLHGSPSLSRSTGLAVLGARVVAATACAAVLLRRDA